MKYREVESGGNGRLYTHDDQMVLLEIDLEPEDWAEIPPLTEAEQAEMDAVHEKVFGKRDLDKVAREASEMVNSPEQQRRIREWFGE